MSGVPVGRRNLFSDRRRAVLGIAGVGTALLMVLMLASIVNGAMRQVTRYIDTSPADVFVAQRGVTNMHMASSAVPLADLTRIRAVPGVAWADPILYLPDALATAGGRQVAYVVGYVPGQPGGPASLVRGRAPGPGQVVIDQRAAGSLGLRVGDSVRLMARTWRISGLASGLTSLANTVAFVRFADLAAARNLTGITSYIMAGARGDPARLAHRITAVTGLSALTRAQFSAQERALVQDMSAQLLQIMNLAGYLIGLAVIAVTLYAATLSRLREAGVMKALGARPVRLANVVLSQALWTVGAAMAAALGLTFVLAVVFGRTAGNVPVALDPGSVARVAAGAIILAALGALAPLIRVWRVDPMTVFRS
jgi:putative ABC transport system permease protein